MLKQMIEIIYSKFIVDIINIYKVFKKYGLDKILTNFGMFLYNSYMLLQDTYIKRDPEKLQISQSENQKDDKSLVSKTKMKLINKIILSPIAIPLIVLVSTINYIAQSAIKVINSPTFKKIKEISIKASNFFQHPTITITSSLICSIGILSNLAISSALANTSLAGMIFLSINYVATMVSNTSIRKEKQFTIKKLKYAKLMKNADKELSQEKYKGYIDGPKEDKNLNKTENAEVENKPKASKITALKKTLKYQLINAILPIIQCGITQNIIMFVASIVTSSFSIASGFQAVRLEENFRLELNKQADKSLKDVKDKSNLTEIAKITYSKLIKLEVLKELSAMNGSKKDIRKHFPIALAKAKQKINREFKELCDDRHHKTRLTRMKNTLKLYFQAFNPFDRMVSYAEIVQKFQENQNNVPSAKIPKKHMIHESKKPTITPAVKKVHPSRSR